MSRVAVVTGGTRGIGAAMSRSLQKAGYKIAATYHGNDKAAEKFTARTGMPHFKFDVGDFDACEERRRENQGTLGPVDILVNNAGITRDAFLHKMTPEQWAEVHAHQPEFRFQHVAARDRRHAQARLRAHHQHQLDQRPGRGRWARPITRRPRRRIIGFTKALALESASKGITVNAIAPGYIDTDMVRGLSAEVLKKIVDRIPVKHLGQPEEIARMVVFLADDAAGFITGATFSINGGQYLA